MKDCMKKLKQKFWSIIWYLSFDLKPKSLRCLAKIIVSVVISLREDRTWQSQYYCSNKCIIREWTALNNLMSWSRNMHVPYWGWCRPQLCPLVNLVLDLMRPEAPLLWFQTPARYLITAQVEHGYTTNNIQDFIFCWVLYSLVTLTQHWIMSLMRLKEKRKTDRQRLVFTLLRHDAVSIRAQLAEHWTFLILICKGVTLVWEMEEDTKLVKMFLMWIPFPVLTYI